MSLFGGPEDAVGGLVEGAEFEQQGRLHHRDDAVAAGQADDAANRSVAAGGIEDALQDRDTEAFFQTTVEISPAFEAAFRPFVIADPQEVDACECVNDRVKGCLLYTSPSPRDHG